MSSSFMPSSDCDRIWLALAIGNSRLHWAWFQDNQFQGSWKTPHLSAAEVKSLQIGHWNFPKTLKQGTAESADDRQMDAAAPAYEQLQDYLCEHPLRSPLEIWIGSVVPQQLQLWQGYAGVRSLSLDQIPLQGTYSTLGVDRALALLGAGETYSWPVLVIDAGTALTFTGGQNRTLIGGAILPGLSLQRRSLAQNTADLAPHLNFASNLAPILPQRWALNSTDAINSGITYTVLAGVRDFIEAWWQQFPGSAVVLTGGDRIPLLAQLQTQFPQLAQSLQHDANLIFQGIHFCQQ